MGPRKNRQDDPPQTSAGSWHCGSRFVAIVGLLTVILLIAVVHVATREERDTHFDELLSTGGAIRAAHEVRRSVRSEDVCTSSECHDISKYIKASMDHTKNPCVDFFDYACGGWIKDNPIPRSSSTFSTFSKLNGHVEKTLRLILEEKSHRRPADLIELPQNMYHSCMDLAEIEKRGAKPLKDLIREIGSWSVSREEPLWDEGTWDLESTLLFIQQNYTSAGGPLFSVHISDDPINNSRHIIQVNQ